MICYAQGKKATISLIHDKYVLHTACPIYGHKLCHTQVADDDQSDKPWSEGCIERFVNGFIWKARFKIRDNFATKQPNVPMQQFQIS